MSAGGFHEIPWMDDSRLAEIFAREVLAFLVGRNVATLVILNVCHIITLNTAAQR